MRQKLVVGNWKMNPGSPREAVALARAVMAMDRGAVRVGAAPPAAWLVPVSHALRGSETLLYGQDVHWEEKGAFTGQTSAAMLVALGATGAIVGHSEVRRDQGDDDERVARKARAALRAGLRVVYCVGESLEQRRSGQTGTVLSRQIRGGVGSIDRTLLEGDPTIRLAIAYEPIWAIGTGIPATGAQASEAIAGVRRELAGLGLDAAAIQVLYGGSVSASSVGEFATAEGVDGALVGGASLKAEEFAAIVRAFR